MKGQSCQDWGMGNQVWVGVDEVKGSGAFQKEQQGKDMEGEKNAQATQGFESLETRLRHK